MGKVRLRTGVAFILSMLLLAGTLSCKKGERARLEIKQGDVVEWEDALSPEQKAMLSGAYGISSIAAGEDNSLWLTTYNGNIYRYDGGELYEFGNLDIVPCTIYTPGDGSIWVGGNGKKDCLLP